MNQNMKQFGVIKPSYIDFAIEKCSNFTKSCMWFVLCTHVCIFTSFQHSLCLFKMLAPIPNGGKIEIFQEIQIFSYALKKSEQAVRIGTRIKSDSSKNLLNIPKYLIIQTLRYVTLNVNVVKICQTINGKPFTWSETGVIAPVSKI